MATNHTPNYNLCQWEGTDPFTRVDFNADNQAVDTALKNISDKLNATPWSIISTVSTQENESESMSLDLSDVDLLSYIALELITIVKLEDIDDSPYSIYLNGRKEKIYKHSKDSGSTISDTEYFIQTPIWELGTKSRRIMFIPPNPNRPVAAYGMMFTDEAMYMEIASCPSIFWDNLTSITITADSYPLFPLLKGSSAFLLGIKNPLL